MTKRRATIRPALCPHTREGRCLAVQSGGECGCEEEVFDSDFGPMRLRDGDELLTREQLSLVAAHRYSRGEDLASTSGRVLSRKERLG